MNIREVTPKPITKDNEEIASHIYRTCGFCQKILVCQPNTLVALKNLSGTDYYCAFCLRHNLRNNSNILGLSYRGIIGYYYAELYAGKKIRRTILYLSELTAMIDAHVTLGLKHPCFSYDSSNYMWYINFNLVGDSTSKAPFLEVEELNKNVFDCFNVSKHVGKYQSDDFYEKMDKSIKSFYKQRRRPRDRKFLIPTFKDIIYGLTEAESDKYRNFLPAQMKIK